MAATKKVICKYCKIPFYKEQEEWIKISTRYAHKACYEKAQKETLDLRKITDLVKDLYAPYEPNWATIGSQLKRYKDEGMTYEGIYHTLIYFFVIKKNDIHKSAGVGIVPYIYNKAKAYYKNTDNIYTKTAKVEKQEKLTIKQQEDIITIAPQERKKELINFSWD